MEFTARPDTVDELRERLLEMTRLTRAEDGCLRYDLHADATDPLRLVFVEEWATRRGARRPRPDPVGAASSASTGPACSPRTACAGST